MIIAGATAYPRLIDFAAFREIADEVGAWLMVDAAHFIGLVAGKAIPSPVPYADVVTFTTHKVLRGPRGGMLLCRPELAARLDKAVFPFSQGGPLMHAVAAKAVALKEALQPEYRDYARQVDRQRAGAGGRAGGRGDAAGLRRHRHPPRAARPARPSASPAPRRRRAATPPRITLNKNAIPYDPQPPMTASGIRVGTPAVTTQGMGEAEMAEVAALIAAAVRDADGSGADEVARRGRAAWSPTTPPTRDRPDRVREYLLTAVVAAAVTYLLTPVARRIALRWGAMTQVRDRDVHAIPTPRLGGVAMLGGFAAALAGRQQPALPRPAARRRRPARPCCPARC